MKKILLKIFFSFCLFSKIFPQPDYQFQHINSDEGLSSNTVTCILQDHIGFLWIGTYDGLNKYDGYDFKVFKHNPDDLTSIGANAIQTLYEDKQGIIWIGTFDGGLSRYDPKTEKFTRYLNNPSDLTSLSSNKVYAICEDDEEYLWVGTANGLNKFNKKTQKFSRYNHSSSDSNSISSDIISSLLLDRKFNVLWIGTKSGGLNKYDLNSKRFKSYTSQKNNSGSLSTDFVYCLYRDTSDILWIGTFDGGLNKLDIRTNRIQVYDIQNSGSRGFNDQTIISIDEDKSGNLLLGTYENGLMVFDKKLNIFYSYQNDPKEPGSIGDNIVNDICVDRSGLIWIGTWNDGLNKINPNRKFDHYKNNPLNSNSVSGNFITALCEDKDGYLWIGTDQKGLNRFDPKNGIFTHFKNDPNNIYSITSDKIADIEEDKEGNLWIAIDGEGFCKYDKKNNRFSRFRHDPNDKNSLPCDQISVIVEQKNGNLLIGTIGGGLLDYNKKKNSFKRIRYDPNDPEDITAYGVYALLEDSKENLWIGTYGTGLFYYDRIKKSSDSYFNIPGDTTSLSDNTISAIAESDDGTIWIGTYNGLNKFDPHHKKFKRYNESNGLPNNTIYGIVIDDTGNLWISTNKGLVKLNPANDHIRVYTKADGLQSDEFNQWAQCKGRRGNIYFGGINGFNEINSDNLKDSDFKPKVAFTDLLLFNKQIAVGYDEHFYRTILTTPIDYTEILELTNDDYLFSIEFLALDYTSSQSIKYAYKMTEFDKEWIYVNADRRFATYTNLSPGEYVFTVKSTNADGVWNEIAKNLAIVVHPPWWKTGWAYSAYGAILIAFIFSIRAYDLKRARLKHQLELEHEHAQKLEELDRMKSNFFANISHEFRTPLTLILGPAEQILSEKISTPIQQSLTLIKRNANHLLHLINQLLDLSRLEVGKLKLNAVEQNIIPFVKGMIMSFESAATANSIRLTFSYAENVIPVFFDSEKLETVLKNLISNAIKFTPPNHEISAYILKASDSLVQIKIKDTGIGIPENEIPKIFDRFYQVQSAHTRLHGGTGIGLALAKELVELHKGRIRVVSKVSEGTEAIIELPLGKDHLSKEQIVDYDIERDAQSSHEAEIDELIPRPKNHEMKSYATNKDIILIVEDNPDVREFIKSSLGDEFTYDEAENGKDGIKKALEVIPDLIISDVMMPILDGNEMTRQLKSDNKTSHIPIILLTAKSGLDNKLEGLETGADDYLTKPFESKELLIRIKNLILLRKKLQGLYSSQSLSSITKSKNKLKGIDAQFLERILKVIDDHISEEEFTIEDFGHEVGMSRSQMFRKIKALTGKSCSVYVRSVRLAKAKIMLQNHEANISEIAYSVGFSSPSYFTHCFKEEFGYSPSELVK